MNALTVRPGDELYKQLVVEARERDWSLNKIALEWLRKGSGMTKKKRNLSGLGHIPKSEWDRIERRIEEAFEVIDDDE